MTDDHPLPTDDELNELETMMREMHWPEEHIDAVLETAANDPLYYHKKHCQYRRLTAPEEIDSIEAGDSLIMVDEIDECIFDECDSEQCDLIIRRKTATND
jgi:hypothetical protein